MQKDGDDYISSRAGIQLYLLYHANTNLVLYSCYAYLHLRARERD